MTMEEYANLRAKYEQATAARTQMIATLNSAVRAMLQSPALFHFSNCEGGFPAEVIMNRTAPSFDANQWPTAVQIQQVFVRWHEARQAAESAWRGLSPEQQKAMQPPAP